MTIAIELFGVEAFNYNCIQISYCWYSSIISAQNYLPKHSHNIGEQDDKGYKQNIMLLYRGERERVK